MTDTTAEGLLALDAESLYDDLRRDIRPLLKDNTQLVGIASGGVWLARRLTADLGRGESVNTLSSSLHRDDFAQRGMVSSTQTSLHFDVGGADILLLDDVLYTGRTIRAVINELFDYGRPARVRLAVLVDRGGRQLPIEADYAAARISLPAAQQLALVCSASGSLSFTIERI